MDSTGNNRVRACLRNTENTETWVRHGLGVWLWTMELGIGNCHLASSGQTRRIDTWSIKPRCFTAGFTTDFDADFTAGYIDSFTAGFTDPFSTFFVLWPSFISFRCPDFCSKNVNCKGKLILPKVIGYMLVATGETTGWSVCMCAISSQTSSLYPAAILICDSDSYAFRA